MSLRNKISVPHGRSSCTVSILLSHLWDNHPIWTVGYSASSIYLQRTWHWGELWHIHQPSREILLDWRGWLTGILWSSTRTLDSGNNQPQHQPIMGILSWKIVLQKSTWEFWCTSSLIWASNKPLLLRRLHILGYIRQYHQKVKRGDPSIQHWWSHTRSTVFDSGLSVQERQT